MGAGFGGGIVECDTERPAWLPYVEVAEIVLATERARLLGASVPLEPREGPAGWRSVVAPPDGAEIAFAGEGATSMSLAARAASTSM